MTKFERRIADRIGERLPLLAAVFFTLVSAYVRFCMRRATNADIEVFLLPWYETIKAGGGFACLGTQVGNYSILYQTLIAAMTYLPIKPVFAYKMLSIGFDYLLAGAVAYLVFINTEGDKGKTAIAWIVAVLLPSVCLDSACWGQCDSIYAFFCVLSLIFLCRGRDVPAFLAAGAAFAFKLQAVFFLPFLLFFYAYKKRFSLLHFLLIPATMAACSLGGILRGRPVWDVFSIYLEQTDTYAYMTLNYPGLWDLLRVPEDRALLTAAYGDLHGLAIALAVGALAVLMLLLLKKKRTYSTRTLTELAFLFAFTCVLFLPGMHERYDYLYLALGIALAVTDGGFALAFSGIAAISLRTYSVFLFGAPETPELYTLLNLACYAFFAIRIMKKAEAEPELAEGEA